MCVQVMKDSKKLCETKDLVLGECDAVSLFLHPSSCLRNLLFLRVLSFSGQYSLRFKLPASITLTKATSYQWHFKGPVISQEGNFPATPWWRPDSRVCIISIT